MRHKKTNKLRKPFLRNNKTIKHNVINNYKLNGGNMTQISSLQTPSPLIQTSENKEERQGIIDKLEDKVGDVVKNASSLVLDKVANLAGYEPIEKQENALQLDLFSTKPPMKEIVTEVKKESKVEQKLRDIDVNTLTPIQAINILENLKQSL